MDRGLIVLACPGSGSARDRLIANLVVYDVLHAAKTRADIPPERRRTFYVFLDEVQTYDGAIVGNLAALLEQIAKYGVRAFLFNQNPERLTPATLNAVTTNRSHLLTTALNAKAAALLARDLGGQIDPHTIANLERFHSIASVTLDGQASPPFRLAGVPADELFPDAARPDELRGARRSDSRDVPGGSDRGHPAAPRLPQPADRRLPRPGQLRRRPGLDRPRPPAPPVTATAAQPRLVETAAEILQGIHQHRLLSTSQIHALHAPHAHISWPQRLLAQLRDLGLVHMTRLPRRPALWHITDPGADATSSSNAARPSYASAPTTPTSPKAQRSRSTPACSTTSPTTARLRRSSAPPPIPSSRPTGSATPATGATMTEPKPAETPRPDDQRTPWNRASCPVR